MTGKPVPPRAIVFLLAGALIGVITVAVVLALAATLGAMGDEAGSSVLHWIALGCGVVLVVDLVCLVLAVSVNSLIDDRPPDEP